MLYHAGVDVLSAWTGGDFFYASGPSASAAHASSALLAAPTMLASRISCWMKQT